MNAISSLKITIDDCAGSVRELTSLALRSVAAPVGSPCRKAAAHIRQSLRDESVSAPGIDSDRGRCRGGLGFAEQRHVVENVERPGICSDLRPDALTGRGISLDRRHAAGSLRDQFVPVVPDIG